MHITFLGTRGFIKTRTKEHYRHASTLIAYRKTKVMIDCGLDWLSEVWTINPTAIVITHAHPDHAFGLRDGSPCPVYATQESWDTIDKYPLENSGKVEVVPRVPFTIGSITFEAFRVAHSIRAPAVGYRITAGKVTIFCVHDLVYIEERHEALTGIALYIGDGASPVRPLIRRRGDVLFGHSPIRTQLTWCQKEEVSRAIFTHCGSQIVNADPEVIERRIYLLGQEKGVEACIAQDGMYLTL